MVIPVKQVPVANCVPNGNKSVEVQEPIASLDGQEMFKHNAAGRLSSHDMSWKNSKPFLQKLACLGKDGEKTAIEFHHTSLTLSQEYCVTGFLFQEGDPDPELRSLIEVNSSIVLALDAEAIGRVMGMDFEGQPVRRIVGQEKGKEVTDLMSTSDRPLLLENFLRADLREYLIQRKKELDLLEKDKRVLSISHAYFLKEEFLHGAQFNWAAHKVDKLKDGLRVRRLTRPLKALLAKYIEAVAPLVCRAFNRNGTAAMDCHDGVQEDPTESQRRVTRQSTLRSKRPPSDDLEDPSAEHSDDHEFEEDEGDGDGDGDGNDDEGRVPAAGLAKKGKFDYHTVVVEQEHIERESVQRRYAREENNTLVWGIKLLESQKKVQAIYKKDKAEFDQAMQKYMRKKEEFEKERKLFFREKMSHPSTKS